MTGPQPILRISANRKRQCLTVRRKRYRCFPQLKADYTQFSSYESAKQDALQRFQRDYIRAVLQQTDGNISQAARKMGISRQGLQKMMKQIGF